MSGTSTRRASWRWYARVACASLTGILLLLIVRDLVLVTRWRADQLELAVGGDYRVHMMVGERVLAGGAYYNTSQFEPYPIRGDDVLYPPVTLYLLGPVSMLPEPLRSVVWWVPPLVIVAAVVAWHRPAWWAWPMLAACCWWWRTSSQIIHGNVVMWIVAALAIGTVYRWVAVLVLVKISVAPFALIGVVSRSWWIAVAAMLVFSIPFLDWTAQYPTILGNLRGDPAYSLAEYPMLAIPLIAWLGGRRHGVTTVDALPRIELARRVAPLERPTAPGLPAFGAVGDERAA